MKNRNLDHKDDWKTPNDLYNKLDQEFEFDFDPCPLHSDFDGLNVEWGQSNFINPPYSRNLKEAFIRKAYEESLKGKLCVMLLPVSTSTKIFHDVVYGNAEIRFIKGRVRFEGTNTFGKPADQNPMHDSMIVIFNPVKVDYCPRSGNKYCDFWDVGECVAEFPETDQYLVCLNE